MGDVDNKNKVGNRYDWVFNNISDSLLGCKKELIINEVKYMLNRTIKMFKYKNLPETIPQKDLEIILQTRGYVTITKVNDKLYAFDSTLGGIPQEYYLPTDSIVANPYLKYFKTLKIDKDCVVVLNDNLYQGLVPIHNKYAIMLVESEISWLYAIFNSRIPQLIEADNDVAKDSAKAFFDKIYKGEEFGIIGSKSLLENGLKAFPFYQENHITELIEAIQYIKGSWFNKV